MTVRTLTLAGTFALFAAPLCAAGPAVDHPLDWMSGCWAHERGDTKEVWSAPEGELMFGYGVSKTDGSVTFFEELRIEEREGGAVYIASPNGGPSTEFIETERTGLSITFENADHDYPQKITYGSNRVALVATISTIDDDKVRSWAMYDCAEREGGVID